MLKFFANLLFALVSNIILPITVGVWLFGYFWVNAPLNYVPNWLWLLTSANIFLLLGLLKIVNEGWGLKSFRKMWLDDGSYKPQK